MATENIIMAIVKNGGDRQEAHEKIRVSIFFFPLAFFDFLSDYHLIYHFPPSPPQKKGPIP